MSNRRLKIALASIAMVLAFGASSVLAAEGITLTLPDLDWALEINSAGFEIQSGGLRPDGLATKAMAVNKTTGIVMSVFIEPAQSAGDNTVCREYFSEGLKQSPTKEDDVVFNETANMALMEYTIKEYEGVAINQKHVNAYIVKDDFWIDIHLSKIEYTDSARKLLDDVLGSVAIVDNYVQTDMDNFIYASSFYMQENLPKAAVYYEKALKKDRASTQLPPDLWRVAVDNLGMVYGMSGDLENSRRVLLKGIEQDPDYPMFYYNLACTYAEMKDKDNALANLRTAYERKDNMIEGEKFPDPRTDSSFQRYLSDPDFVALLEEMAG